MSNPLEPDLEPGNLEPGKRERRNRETDDQRQRRLSEFANRGGSISHDEYRKKSRRSFLGFVPTAVAGFMGFKYVQGRPTDGNIPDWIRRGLEFNEDVWDVLGRDGLNAPTFSIADREDLRVNGLIGMRARGGGLEDLDLDSWQLTVIGTDGSQIDVVDLADIQSLPEHDIVWEHKCIEGWSEIAHWTGARFADFARRYEGVLGDYDYVSLETPDRGYYVGVDAATMLHDQTLLAWGLSGEPLSQAHGAPLRLATPHKYGIKQIKRIGVIEFTNSRPADYWAERGYDWDAGF